MKKAGGRGPWTAAEDQLVFFTFGILPFSEVRSGLKLLPNRTPAEVYERFLALMSDAALQDRLLKETRGHIVGSHRIKWQPHELFAAVQIPANDPETDLSAVLSQFPWLFHPSRTPDTVAKTCSMRGAREPRAIAESQARYISFAEDLHQRMRAYEPWPIEKPDMEEIASGAYNVPQKEPPKPVPKEHPPMPVRDEARVNAVCAMDVFPVRIPRKLPRVPIPKALPVEKQVNIVTAIKEKALAGLKPNVLAVLIGRRGAIHMTKSSVTMGRATPLTHPDIDLSGYCMQSIARIHCEVSLRSDLEFYLKCCARDVIIDGTLFRSGDFVRLRDGCMIDVGVPFLFVENPLMMKKLREKEKRE